MIKHDLNHMAFIHPLSETETNLKRIPVLIARDLEELRLKVVQMQNHCVLEKEALKKLTYSSLHKISTYHLYD